MENSNKNTESKNPIMDNGIKEKRLRALKGKYQKPEMAMFTFKEMTSGECSDMGSCQPVCSCNACPANYCVCINFW